MIMEMLKLYTKFFRNVIMYYAKDINFKETKN